MSNERITITSPRLLRWVLQLLAWGAAGLGTVAVCGGVMLIWRFIPSPIAGFMTLLVGIFLGYGFAGEDITFLPEMAKEVLPKIAVSMASLT